METQGRNFDAGKIFWMGAKDKAKNKSVWDKAARDKAVKPVGEWNSYEVVVRGQSVVVTINGVKVTEITSHEYPAKGHIGFQSEGVEIHWKNIRIKELK